MSKPRPILIIDDDQQLVTMLSELLQLEGFAVDGCHSGESGIRALADTDPSLIILDVMMPGIDGFETLRRIRVVSEVPVIMLTARGEAEDRILGLEHGADDYLGKPFKPRELLLRIRAILKRKNKPGIDETLSYHALELQPQAMRATLAGQPLTLTGAELRILEVLTREAGGIASREQLTQYALGRQWTPYDRALDTHISNLRHKLASADDALQIRNVRGSGYALLPVVK